MEGGHRGGPGTDAQASADGGLDGKLKETQFPVRIYAENLLDSI